MKLHWGYGLAVVSVLFAAVIVTMVSISMNREVDLVADDYYQQELRHEEQIDRQKRSADPDHALAVTVRTDTVTVRFPGIHRGTGITGSIHFYRPSDKKKDFTVAIELDSGNVQHILTASMIKGFWRVKILWNDGKADCYKEDVLFLQ